jgi:hypothetical protein
MRTGQGFIVPIEGEPHWRNNGTRVESSHTQRGQRHNARRDGNGAGDPPMTSNVVFELIENEWWWV